MSGMPDDETPDAASRAAAEPPAPAPEREPETLFELTDAPAEPAASEPHAVETAASASAPAAPAPDALSPAAPAPPPPPPASARASTRLGDDLSVIEDTSQDGADDDETPRLPGTHRGGFRRLPTAPVAVVIQTAPAEPGTEEDSATGQWLTRPPAPQRGLAGWALAFSIAGLVVSLFIGWGFPIGFVGAISAIFALRRPLENRGVAIWALVLGLVSVVYSAGWLLWAATQANLLG